MKIGILSDRSTLHHPFARLLVESLSDDGHEVVLASTDPVNGKAFYDFSKSVKILDGYNLIRVPKYKSIVSMLNRRFKIMSPMFRFPVLRVRDIDRRLTKFRARQIVSLLGYLLAANNAFRLKVDVVIISRPQTVLAQLVLIILRKIKFRQILFVYYPYELYGQQNNKYNRLVLLFERIFIRNVYDSIVAPSAGRLTYYKSINSDIQGCVVRNFKRFIPNERVDSKQTKRINLVYLGLVDYGRKLEEIIAHLEQLPSTYKLTFIGKIRKQWLKDNQDNLNYWISLGKLELIEAIPESTITERLSLYDIGLISYDDNCLNNRLCAPAKVTDYWHSDLPIIAPNLPGMKEIVELNSNVYLYNSTDVYSLFTLLRDILPILRVQAPGAISHSSSMLNWDNEYESFQGLLDSLLNKWAQTGSNRRPTD
jgi:glycosyltransferase involved in cell wall biosynthesis